MTRGVGTTMFFRRRAARFTPAREPGPPPEWQPSAAADASGYGSMSQDWEHCRLVIEVAGDSIRSADTKTSILAAALGLSLTFAVPRLQAALNAVDDHPIVLVVWLVLVAGMIAFAVASAVYVYRSLVPRTVVEGGGSNRFAWPSLAATALADLPPATKSAEDVRREAWVQAATLSRIAREKHRCFTRALRMFCLYLGFVAVLVVGQALVSYVG